jgi:hypothetical protein
MSGYPMKKGEHYPDTPEGVAYQLEWNDRYQTGAGVAKREAQAAETQKERAGKVNDFFWKLGNYMFLTCGCGTVLKVPPDFRAAQVRCPHCSALHPLSAFQESPPGPGAPASGWSDVAS